ncbi:hypothetical protein CJO85_01095 [Ralstonia solanacearum]|nr:hypothetical protein CJO85_01095 [Ralstonia solanacearum]
MFGSASGWDMGSGGAAVHMAAGLGDLGAAVDTAHVRMTFRGCAVDATGEHAARSMRGLR